MTNEVKRRRFISRLLYLSCLAYASSASSPWRKQNAAGRYSRDYGDLDDHDNDNRNFVQRNPSYRPPRKDYNVHFLDYEDVVKDNRARVYKVDFKKRTIGKLSWTSKLIWSNIATFGLQSINPRITQLGIKLSDRIMRGQELYRLVTPVFLHGNIGHLFTNMISLSRVGPDVEKLFGKGRFMGTFIVSGIAGNLLSAYMSPNPALGASGAVFGIVSAYFIFASRHEWLLGSYGQQMTTNMGTTMLFNVVLGAMNPVIDNYGHLGGAIGGAVMAYYFGPRLYLTEVPTGNNHSSARIMIDKPVLRLPPVIEHIPSRIMKKTQTVMDQLNILQRNSSGKGEPWQDNTRQNNAKQYDPTRSIKPGPV